MTSRSYDQPDSTIAVPYTHELIAGAPPPADFVQNEVTRVRRGYYSGGQTPSYYRKVARGELLPLNGYERFDSFEDRPQGTYGGEYYRASPLRHYRFKAAPCRVVVGASRTIEKARLVMAEMSRQVNTEVLLQRALSNINPDLDALTTMAELNKTVSMVLQARKQAIKLINQGLSGNIRTAAKAVGNAWLSWRYGWRILGYDIQAVSNLLKHPIRGYIAMGTSGDSVQDIVEVPDHPVYYHAQYDYNTRLHRDLNVRAMAVAKFTSKSVNAFADIATTAWELVPFSFVADWFVSVGDSLKAWRILRSSSAVECAISYRFHEVGEASVSNVTVGSGTYAIKPQASGQSRSTVTLLTRVPRSAPTLFPQTYVNLDPSRFADAAALLAKRIL